MNRLLGLLKRLTYHIITVMVATVCMWAFGTAIGMKLGWETYGLEDGWRHWGQFKNMPVHHWQAPAVQPGPPPTKPKWDIIEIPDQTKEVT